MTFSSSCSPQLTEQANISKARRAVSRCRRHRKPDDPRRPPADAKATTVFEDIAHAHREIYALYEIAQTMGTSLGVSDTMSLITSKLMSLVPFMSCALFLYDEPSETLRCRFATGLEAEDISRLMMRSGQGLSGWVARNKRPLVNARPSADFEAAGITGRRRRCNPRWSPLMSNDVLIGTLVVYHTAPDFYTDDHRRLLERCRSRRRP